MFSLSASALAHAGVGRGRLTALGRRSLFFGTMLIVAACSPSDLLDVDDPEIVTPDAVADAAGAEALRAGAVVRLTDAISGAGTPRIALVSGLLADEFTNANLRGGLVAIDQRIADETFSDPTFFLEPFRNLHIARFSATDARAALVRYAPTAVAKIAQMLAAEAFTEVFLGETYCSGIPMSDAVGGDLRPGQPLTIEQVFLRALAHFDSALTSAGGDVRIGHLARIGRARALLDLGRFEDAAAAVSGVPTNYTYNLEHPATSAGANGVFAWTLNSRIITIAEREGGTGLDFRSAADPRVTIVEGAVGEDGRTRVYGTAKFRAQNAPMPLATGIEARLIEAEALLKAGRAEDWLALLNVLRTSAITPSMAPLSLPATSVLREDLHFRERAFWLFGTGHRLGDLRRLVRQYGRAATSVFPSGPLPGGGSYGSEVVLPIPQQERNNPLFSGCIDSHA